MSYNSILRPGLFQDYTIIVTGGGSGIGRCTAHELAYLGAKVVLLGRTLEKLVRVQAEITEDGGNACYYTLDIRDEVAVKEVVKQIITDCGQVHGLVNNAGGQFPAPLKKISQNGFETVVRNNLIGGFLMAREVYLQSMQQHGGAIVNITADNWGGMPGMGHSGAARAGMDNLTKTAAWEWGRNGVRVNAIAPGWVASSGMDTYEGAMKALIPKLKNEVPLGRIAMEAEVSAAICFLLSDGAAFISGDTLRVDGGASQGSATWPLSHEASRNSSSFQGFHRAVLPEVLKVSE